MGCSTCGKKRSVKLNSSIKQNANTYSTPKLTPNLKKMLGGKSK